MLFPTEDIILSLNASTDVEAAKVALRKQKELDPARGIRFFYNGREMIDGRTFGNYSYNEGSVVQAMIR